MAFRLVRKGGKKSPEKIEAVDGVLEDPPRAGEDSKPSVHLPVIGASGKPDYAEYVGGLPPLACRTCSIGPSGCSEYEEASACYFEKDFSKFGNGSRDLDEIESAMYMVVSHEIRRLNMALLIEKTVSGGAISAEATQLSNSVMQKLALLRNMKFQAQSITVRSEGKQTGGILAALFGGSKTVVTPGVDLNPGGEQVPAVDGGENTKVEIELRREVYEDR